MERAAHEPDSQQDDPQTSREEMELDLMESDASEAGEVIGEEND